MKLHSLKIGARLGGGFAIILSLMVLMTAIAIARLNDVDQDTRAMMTTALAKERLVGEQYLTISVGVRRNSAIAISSEPKMAAYFAEETKSSTARVAEIVKALKELPSTLEEEDLISKIQQARKELP